MAGSGLSADEIALAIGNGMDAQAVYALLRRLGVKLLPKTRAQIAFPVAISREAFDMATLHAGNADPHQFAGKLLEAALMDRWIFETLLESIEE
jgi:hypothetical protein